MKNLNRRCPKEISLIHMFPCDNYKKKLIIMLNMSKINISIINTIYINKLIY